MTKSGGSTQQAKNGIIGSAPSLNISNLGIVSRDYQRKYGNGYRDFSYTLADVLKLLDDQVCVAVLFSLFSIIPRKSYDPCFAFRKLKNINAVFLEEFRDGKSRKKGRYVIYHRTSKGWVKYEFSQVFGTITGKPRQEIDDFVRKEMPKRILGNCCVLLCGETNGVKYSKKDKHIHDDYGVRLAIPQNVNIVLNPIHDRMTRFEMKLKRQFLSENDRWVISVWNKGKKDRNGNSRDGQGPPWTVFHNGVEKEVELIPNQLGVEIGILDSRKP
jgi:hypothetical protein